MVEAFRPYALRAVILLMIVLFSMARTQSFMTPSESAEMPGSYAKIAENDHFRLYMDTTTLAFKVRDKRNDYLWHSGIDELQPDDRLNRPWQAFARSGLSIDYLDERGISRRVSVVGANHTLKITPLEQGISALLTFDDYEITIGLKVYLTDAGVRVEVPFDTISEGSSRYRLGKLYLYPFLGATRGGSVSGYMVLPDGVGSLIRFADTTRARSMFFGRYYGPDVGMIATLPHDPWTQSPYPISFPAYGIVHGEGYNAVLVVVEEGAAYGELQAHPAGIITNFNFVYNAFIYNESYFQAINRAGDGVIVVQREPNAFDIAVQYHFLTGELADYVGMARKYRHSLIQRGLLRNHFDSNPAIGIRLEFLGGDKERVLFWHRVVAMTTIQQLVEILTQLNVDNPQVIYYGWQPRGASSMPPLALRVEPSLGGLDELRALASAIAEKGGSLWLYLDPQAAFPGESGYSPRHELAMAITSVNLKSHNRHASIHLNAQAVKRRLHSMDREIALRQAELGLALDGIGWMLYGDFRAGRPLLNRTEAIKAYQDALQQTDTNLSLYRPNDYLWAYAQAYYDMPLGDNGYIYTSKTVPFLPIVLSGLVPYYGPPLNFSANLREDVLRHIDFGIYPSFFLTYESTATMLNTPSSWIYTSAYVQWGERIRDIYQWMNALLAPVRGQEIVARRQLSENVFASIYANGKTIVVNYGDLPFTYNGKTVPALDAVLWEALP